MSDAIHIGSVPTGSIVIRQAGVADLRIDPLRIALVRYPDGREVWLTTGLPEIKPVRQYRPWTLGEYWNGEMVH